MTIVINKTDTPAQIEKKLAQAVAAAKKGRKKGFKAKKYAGRLKGLYGHPLAYQKRLRDEWE